MKFTTVKASEINNLKPFGKIRTIFIKNLILDEKIDRLPYNLKNITIKNFTELDSWNYHINNGDLLVSFYVMRKNITKVITKLPFGCTFSYYEYPLLKKKKKITISDLF